MIRGNKKFNVLEKTSVYEDTVQDVLYKNAGKSKKAIYGNDGTVRDDISRILKKQLKGGKK